ncbi:MAG: LytTR family transcriptional regulator [Myxococcales bacterium]|nr:MAG: LytTR family transcriptional regulator [Myxococcales bacterium]
MTKDARFPLDRTLAELEQILPEKEFFRSHRTVLVRLDKIEAIEVVSKGVFALQMNHPDHLCVPLARDRAKELRARIPTLG